MQSPRLVVLAGSLLGSLLLLPACAPEPPQVSAIDPESGPPGATVTISGVNLTDGTKVRLGGKDLAGLVVTPPGTITGTVPDGLSAGPVDLLVKNDAGTVSRSKAFEVVPAAPADPCADDLRRMTHIPSDGSVVKIDLYRGEDVDRQQISTRDITGIEVERTKGAKGLCSAIWLRTGQARVLFDAQVDHDLREQAQKIANGLGKPLSVTRDEGPEEGAGAEEAGAKEAGTGG
ncbi:MAG: IPT/TIG domain-containing protein [Alphaproteobacteria bacterium]|nr:IPT/TIG domain-containing protein [Alphaproteobacteria bacterium]